MGECQARVCTGYHPSRHPSTRLRLIFRACFKSHIAWPMPLEKVLIPLHAVMESGEAAKVSLSLSDKNGTQKPAYFYQSSCN